MSELTLKHILDVTLRDGGYLNRWQFSEDEIKHLLNFLSQQGIQQVEIGFLQIEERTTSAVNGCPVSFLAKIYHQFPDIQLVTMLNPAEEHWQQAVSGKLPYLSMIRLTCTADLVEQALEIAVALHKQSDDIKVSINLISISSYTHDEIIALLQKINLTEAVDLLYFADSRGALYPQDIPPLITLAKKYSNKPVGFHAHDTLGHAIENSNCAFACGCDMIDVSLNGFGLAGGNTSLTTLLLHNNLAKPNLKLGAKMLCQEHFTLQHDAIDVHQLYAILAQKNIDPMWSDALIAQYPNNLLRYVDMLPRRYYKSLSQVLDIIDEYANNSTKYLCSM